MLLAFMNRLPGNTWGKYGVIFLLGMVSLFAMQKAWQVSAMCDEEFNLINPESACTNEQEELSEWEYEPLRLDILRKVASYTSTQQVPHIALYFRDLEHGSRFSIREDEIFEPASLLKVPIMMVILHEADQNPEFLNERITYEKESSYRFITGSVENTLELGASYTIRELMEKMIRYSDNSSTDLLMERINDMGLQENSNVFSDLGTMQMVISGQLDSTRLISLVNIFSSLYNASYLSNDSSQLALELLSQTNFDQGLVNGVPEDVRVAHKYGMRVGSVVEENELHDCGIVYHESTPYILCILTAGADMEVASAAIQDISKTVYEKVDGLEREDM